jgi:dTDP-4-dehydrorhamnose reductase
MKILITGASSYVGARLFLDLACEHKVIGTYTHHQISDTFIHLDITNPNEVNTVISTHLPDVILHVASNPHPEWCEAHPKEAKQLNVIGTQNIVDAANANHAKIIYMSSFAAINPINIYSFTKKDSENIVKTTTSGYINLRPSFILGFSPNTKNDRSFNRLLKNLDQGTPAIYDTSWKFQPTYLGHLSKIVLTCIEKSIWNHTIHVTTPEHTTRFDSANDILSPFGVTVSPIDNHDTTPFIKNRLSELKTLNLPQYTYQDMIREIIDEIKHRDRYIL